MIELIFASSKPWHYDAFEAAFFAGHYQKHYVSTQDQLTLTLSRVKNPRYIFFLHWNWKVPQNIIDIYECVCFHMTDLPYGRGGSPLQNLILDGKTETALTAFRMVEEMDAGPIYAKKTMSLAGRAEEIYRRAGDLCWEMIDWIVCTEPTPQPQAGQVTVFKRRMPSESAMPESGSMPDLYNFIRMLDAPTYPKAFIDHGDFRYEFDFAEILNDEIRARVTIRRKNGAMA
jgi:methionyl-tRNA formyltransferase